MSNTNQPKKKTKPPRPAETYRQNYGQGIDPKGRWRARVEVFKDGSNRDAITLNRSDKWPRAKSYAYAREISPSSEPVR
jgi:hypothetical protein